LKQTLDYIKKIAGSVETELLRITTEEIRT
jgi:hypothetical protein